MKGAAFEVQTVEQVQLLQQYETKHYRKAACRVFLDDGTMVFGKTFMWFSSEEELHEGVFDLKAFQARAIED